MLSKNCMINWLSKSILLILRWQILKGGLVNKKKKQYDSDNQGLEKKIEDTDEKISNTSGLVKKNSLQYKNHRD